MKTKILSILTVLVGLISGSVGGLYPIFRISPELIEARIAALQQEDPFILEKPWDFWTVEVEELGRELKETRARLAEREVQLEARAVKIAAEMEELERTRREIEALRRQLDQQMFRIEESESRNLRNLANTYAALEPPAAIAILSEMEETTVVKILALMKPDSVAEIFNEMGRVGADPRTLRRAAQLSEKLRLFDRDPPR